MLIRTNQLIGDGLRVLAIDPGKTTGVAIATLTPADGMAVALSYQTQVIDWPDSAAWLASLIKEADLVICEDWRLRPNKALQVCGDVLWGDRCAGYVEGTCVSNWISLCWQQPSEMTHFREYIKGTITNMDEGWPKSEHAQDALVHLFVWLLKGENNNG